MRSSHLLVTYPNHTFRSGRGCCRDGLAFRYPVNLNADLWSEVGDAGQPHGFPAQIELQRGSRIEEVATMSSEQQLEEQFIQKLLSLKYEYRPDIRVAVPIP